MPANKGRTTLHKEYIQNTRKLKKDDTQYHILSKDPTVKTENKISKEVKVIHAKDT